MATSFLVFVVFATAVLSISNGSILHKGPRGSTPKKLRGHTLTKPTRGNRGRHPVDFEADILRDVLFWEEHMDEGISLKRCTNINTETRKSLFVLNGKNLDVNDYQVGSVLVMNKEDYASDCGKHIPTGYDEIPDRDQSLFLNITKVKTNTPDKVKLVL